MSLPSCLGRRALAKAVGQPFWAKALEPHLLLEGTSSEQLLVRCTAPLGVHAAAPPTRSPPWTSLGAAFLVSAGAAGSPHVGV